MLRNVNIALVLCISLYTPWSLAKVKLDVEGIDDPLKENVIGTLSIKSGKNDMTRSRLNRLVKEAPKEVAQALQPYGYYSPNVNSRIEQDDGNWIVTLNIVPGPQTTIEVVSIIINSDDDMGKELEAIVFEENISPGDPLNHPRYKELKAKLLNTAYNAGYIEAEYSMAEIRVDVAEHAAYIFLTLDVGRQYFFGDITVEQDILRPQFVRRYTEKFVGQPFESQRLLDLKFNLNSGGYFNSVELDVQRDEAENNYIPIHITTKPAPRFKYTGSIGWGDDTGYRIGAGVNNRRVNKRGHKFNNNARYSEFEKAVVSSYIIPTGDLVNEFYEINVSAREEEIDNTYDTVEYSTTVSYTTQWWGGVANVGLKYLQEDFRFKEEDPYSRAELLMPGVSYTHVNTDNPIFARLGYSFALSLHGGIESIVSETTFFQLRFNASAVFSITDNLRLIGRTEHGFIATENFDQLPPSERFYTGGSQSVRGYGYKEISPTNPDGDLVGGKTLVANSVELDYIFDNNWGAAIFVDAGTATDEENYNLYKSAGIGLRYKTPVGLIRFDIAHPFDELRGDTRDYRLHLNIGPELQ